MNTVRKLGEVIAKARRDHDAPTVNTGGLYDGRLPGEMAEAKRMQTAAAALAEVRAENMPALLIETLTKRLGPIGAERVLGDAMKGVRR